MEIIRYILPVMTFILGIVIGWLLDKNLSDRPLLRNEIYSPLYEEVNMMCENVSEFKDCNKCRYGRPDYSAPTPADKVPGNVRNSLIRRGKYRRIPQNLRLSLDVYYNRCCNDWNPLVDVLNRMQDLKEGKITDIKVKNEGKGVVIQYSNGHGEELYSLTGKPDYSRYESIKSLNEGEIKGQLEAMRQDLNQQAEDLLKELQERIRDPNPLKSLFSF